MSFFNQGDSVRVSIRSGGTISILLAVILVTLIQCCDHLQKMKKNQEDDISWRRTNYQEMLKDFKKRNP